MKKQNFSTIEEDINRVDNQGKKVLFLQNVIQELKESSLLNPELQVSFIDHELTEFFEDITVTVKKALLPLLTKRHKLEENTYNNLMGK